MTLDTKLRFDQIVAETAIKAFNSLGFVRRSLPRSFVGMKSAAQKSLVRSIVDYANASWDSVTATHKKTLEDIQMKAA